MAHCRKGIVHCEMFPLLNPSEPNPAELFQIWLNLPSADKFVEPYFSMFWDQNIPRHTVLRCERARNRDSGRCGKLLG